MPLTIDDDVLQQLGMTAEDARLDLACRWFEAGRLTMAQAARMAGLDRAGIESALRQRNIAVYRPTVADYEQDVRNLQAAGLIRDDRRRQ